jgi:flagellin-like hook-associated protein FlgL
MEVPFVTNDLSFNVLFKRPTNVLNKDTMFIRPSDRYTAEYLSTEADIQVPVQIEVYQQTSEQANLVSTVSRAINSGIDLNSRMQAYLENALSELDQLSSLAELASEDGAIDRSELDESAQNILEDFDRFYNDVEYNGEKILQGGTGYISTGVDGQLYKFSYANLDRANLGLSDIDISTESSAADSLSKLETAISNLEGQQNLLKQDEANLTEIHSVNLQSLAGKEQGATIGAEKNYGTVATANSKAAINERMINAVGEKG